MKVKIHKISGGASMRTDTIVGEIYIVGTTPLQSRLPEVGEQPVVFNAQPLDNPEANTRMFNTSKVSKHYDVDGGRQITTESGSIYFIEPM